MTPTEIRKLSEDLVLILWEEYQPLKMYAIVETWINKAIDKDRQDREGAAEWSATGPENQGERTTRLGGSIPPPSANCDEPGHYCTNFCHE